MGNISCKDCTSVIDAAEDKPAKSYKKGKHFKSKLSPIAEVAQELNKSVSFKPMVDVLQISTHSSEKEARWYSSHHIRHMADDAKESSRREYHERTGPIFDNPKKQRALKKYQKSHSA